MLAGVISIFGAEGLSEVVKAAIAMPERLFCKYYDDGEKFDAPGTFLLFIQQIIQSHRHYAAA